MSSYISTQFGHNKSLPDNVDMNMVYESSAATVASVFVITLTCELHINYYSVFMEEKSPCVNGPFINRVLK